jgi:hypothetical protein
MEIYTHNFSPGMKITVDKIQILGNTIPTNGKYEGLIKLNYVSFLLKQNPFISHDCLMAMPGISAHKRNK